MARIDLNLAHAYKPDPKQDSDYARLKMGVRTRCLDRLAAGKRHC
jgi:hypothetical protein